jgi:hypothetical protein
VEAAPGYVSEDLRVPRSCWLTTSERIASWVAKPPALRTMWASPTRRPRASSTSIRASMQARIAIPVRGAAVSDERS